MSVQLGPLDEVRRLLAEADPEQELAPCGIRFLVLGSDAIASVAETVADLVGTGGWRPRVTLLVDHTPIRRRGHDVKALVEAQLRERFEVRRAVLRDGHRELHVSDEVLDAATRAATGADAVVAVGGGTISDIGKVAAARATTEGGGPVLVSVQTAASVDGYTDDVSVVLRDGVKRTIPSRWPDAVIADAETIAEAPAEMNRAGFGEMTSMLVAPADWRLASLLGTDSGFHRGPIRLLEEVGADIDSWSAAVKEAEPQGVERLTRALAIRGIATGVAGTTACLSGMEHLISHMLDLHHAEHHLPMGLHGMQVGVASVVAAAAWEMLFERLSTSGARMLDAYLDEADAGARIEAAFAPVDASGRIAAECWNDYSAKLRVVRGLRGRIDAVLDGWAAHEADLCALVRPSAFIAAALRAAGAALTFEELDPLVKPDLARWAVANCGLMRNRFTVVDLLTFVGWWTPADVDEVMARAAESAAATSEIGA